jgi:hypothetical protein
MVESGPLQPEPGFDGLDPLDGGATLDGVDAEQLSKDLATVAELAAAGVEIDGEAQVCESTWVVYGNSGYGGEVVVGEYQSAAEAEAVLRAIRRDGTDDPEVLP